MNIPFCASLGNAHCAPTCFLRPKAVSRLSSHMIPLGGCLCTRYTSLSTAHVLYIGCNVTKALPNLTGSPLISSSCYSLFFVFPVSRFLTPWACQHDRTNCENFSGEFGHFFYTVNLGVLCGYLGGTIF